MKKLVAESLNEYHLNEIELIKGEKETGITVDDVDPEEFLVGMEVEKIEHSSDIGVQKVITLQHLAENPKYYSELVKSGMVDEPAALNVYKKYFIDKEEPSEEDKNNM